MARHPVHRQFPETDSPQLPSRPTRLWRWAGAGWSAMLLCALSACSTHHWAPVAHHVEAPPPGERVIHSARLVVDVQSTSRQTQCVVYEGHHPVCFYNLRDALQQGLLDTLWASYPEVVLARAKDAQPGDYVLQVEVTLDALPPDDAGPGWSAGARSRYRLLRDGKVLREATLASRSRAHFPYGAPLGEGASEVIDATILHVAQEVAAVEELQPRPKPLVPRVASKAVLPSRPSSPEAAPGLDQSRADADPKPAPGGELTTDAAKSDPSAVGLTSGKVSGAARP